MSVSTFEVLLHDIELGTFSIFVGICLIYDVAVYQRQRGVNRIEGGGGLCASFNSRNMLPDGKKLDYQAFCILLGHINMHTS